MLKFGLMVVTILEISWVVPNMVKVFIIGQTVQSIKVNGLLMKCLEMVLSNG